MPLAPSHRGVLALFSCSVIYSFFGPLVRILATMFGTYTQVAARMGLAFVFLFFIGLIFKKIRPLTRAQVIQSMLLGIISTSIIVFFTIAITSTKIASTIFLLYAASIAASLIIGTIFFKESLGIQKVIALALAFSGLYLFVSDDITFGMSFGVLAAILSGLSEGIGNGIRKGLRGADKITVTIIQFLVIALSSSLLIFIYDETAIRTVSIHAIGALTLFSSLQLALNYLLLYGFQHFDVNIGTIILALELFFASLLGYIFFHETLALREIAGGIIIFAASILSAWEFKK